MCVTWSKLVSAGEPKTPHHTGTYLKGRETALLCLLAEISQLFSILTVLRQITSFYLDVTVMAVQNSRQKHKKLGMAQKKVSDQELVAFSSISTRDAIDNLCA